MQRISDKQWREIKAIGGQEAADIIRAIQTIVPREYVCYRTAGPLTIDGHLDEPSWLKAPWTEPFGHIVDPEGVPYLTTRAKMLWDGHYFYVGAILEDPDIWGTQTKRDAHICAYDKDFEVFFDPDSDAENYMEFEMNALNCVWDLLLPKCYNRGGQPKDEFDWQGIRSAVQVVGTLNCPWVTDKYWSVEIAFDFASMVPYCVGTPCPPKPGDQWRINFSRVERDREGTYGFDWTWSCQGVYNMHVPEMWGWVQFSDKVVGTGYDAFVEKE